MDGNLPHLPWPQDLYSATRTATALHTKVKQEDLCTCNCKQRHNHAVSKVMSDHGPMGTNYRIYWFANMRCRNKWEAANG